AGRLQDWQRQDKPAVVFIIGAADGLAPSLREKASLAIAFGAATWPHQLIRIMLLEQLYRAVTILARHPYHRACSAAAGLKRPENRAVRHPPIAKTLPLVLMRYQS